MIKIFMQRYRNDEPGAEGPGDGKPTVDELMAQINALNAEKESILQKNNELLGESKKAKAARKQVEQEAAERERQQALADNNFEQLYKSSMAELEKERSERQNLINTIGKKETRAVALELAGTLAEGPNARLLAEFVERRLRYVDGDVKVTDGNGDLTVSTLADLANDFKASGDYDSLLKGNQATGGSAKGGDKSGGGATMTRSDFESLNPVQQRAFFKEGGKLVEK